MADAQPQAQGANFLANFKLVAKNSEIMFAIAIMSIIFLLIFPIPKGLLSFMLAISISLSVVILMTVLFIQKPLELSSFPSILLISAIFRLALNIASTRLILSHGHEGPDAAGGVIHAFGSFVMANNAAIGIIVFGILTVINFVVITKGSGRVAEVAARFSLDAMPGKQMAIDADLSAGLIDEATAKSRRKELEDESTFFGSMDGANKFVRGDAIAGLLITFINIIGGIIIGTVQKGLDINKAFNTYTILTIGDGLVSQVPSLIVSTAAGLLVTKAGVSGSADKAVLGQLSKYPNAMFIVSGLLIFMGLFMPEIPTLPFAVLASITGYIGWYMHQANKQKKIDDAKQIVEQKEKKEVKPNEEQEIASSLSMDLLRLELGYGLLPLINYEKGHRITEQIKALRKQLARDLGFVMPPVRIQDNMQLGANQYVVKVKEIESGTGTIRPDMLLVMNPSGDKILLPGEATTEPTFGLPAMWISENQREDALFKNYTVVDPPTVITTHLTELIKENMAELLSFAEVQKLIDDIPEQHKKLAAEVIPNQMTISGLKSVLQNLLSEMVSIRDLSTILEGISEAVQSTKNITIITEHVRSKLARQICNSQIGAQGYIPVLALSPSWEKTFVESLVVQNGDTQLAMQPSKLNEFMNEVRKVYDQFAMKGELPVLLTSAGIRPYVRSLIERFRNTTVVMSQNEIHPKFKIKTLGQL